MALNNLINSPFPTVVAKGGTGLATLTLDSLYVGNGTSAPIALGAATNGQLPIGSTGAAPVLAALTQGTGISITNGAGSITIAATGGNISWVNQTATTVTMNVNSGYINTSTGAAQVTYTIPAAAAIGDRFRIVGKSAGGWVLQANTGQTVQVGEVACSSAGTWTNGGVFDSIEIVCITANVAFSVISGVTADLTST
jgi:hypothetical protein